nr:MAG TPA: hypothetical protein [Caudoviricetes sp.]
MTLFNLATSRLRARFSVFSSSFIPYLLSLLFYLLISKLNLIIAHDSWAVNIFFAKKLKKFSFRGFYVIILL